MEAGVTIGASAGATARAIPTPEMIFYSDFSTSYRYFQYKELFLTHGRADMKNSKWMLFHFPFCQSGNFTFIERAVVIAKIIE